MTWTLEEKVGQMMMVGFHGTTAPDYLLEWLREGRVGGVIFFGRNVETPEQVAKLTQSLHEAAKHPILVAIDQEGGTVARMRGGFSESPGAMALSASHEAESLTELTAYVLGVEMRALGINWDYAPVLDITYNAENPTVGTRSFGADAKRVGLLASAMVRGLQKAGVAACGKHFPGLGNTTIDTHLALPTIDTPVEHILEHDILPYRAAIQAGIASIMTTHTTFTTLDAHHPATLSAVTVNKLLRGELAYQGVVTTDCLEMKAIADNYGAGESAILAALGGIDIILFSHTPEMQRDGYNALVEAVKQGRVPMSLIDAALERIQKLKAQFAITQAPNTSIINCAEHREIMDSAARAGTVLLHAPQHLFPLSTEHAQQTLVIEFASVLDSEVMESGGLTGLAECLQNTSPQTPIISLKATRTNGAKFTQALDMAAEANMVIIATRNAHLIADELAQAQELMNAAKKTVLLCLRNPFDANLLSADVVLCTCGDSRPSLQAAIDALYGLYAPTGTLPVPLNLEAHQ